MSRLRHAMAVLAGVSTVVFCVSKVALNLNMGVVRAWMGLAALFNFISVPHFVINELFQKQYRYLSTYPNSPHPALDVDTLETRHHSLRRSDHPNLCKESDTRPSITTFRLVAATLAITLPQIFKFVLTFIPVLMGYVVVGTMLFGNYSSRFSTISSSLITLFSVGNGTLVHQIQTHHASPFD